MTTAGTYSIHLTDSYGDGGQSAAISVQDGVTSGQAGDACNGGDLGWTQSSTTDHDTDGCQDSNEDTDDDNDGVADSADSCYKL